MYPVMKIRILKDLLVHRTRIEDRFNTALRNKISRRNIPARNSPEISDNEQAET